MEPTVPVRVSLPSDGGSQPERSADLVDLRAGYSEVFATHHHRLLRLAYLLTGDRDRAEEAVAESFAKVWPHWRRGRVHDQRGYLTRAVVNEVRSAGRRLGRTDRLVVRLVESAMESTPGDDDAASRVAVVAALAKLPRRQREVVVLRFWEDLTETGTAAALGMRLGTVKSQTARGLTRLRLLLLEEER